jgi:NhaA family Na+:H+ antiporter
MATPLDALRRFFQLESAGGILLVGAAVIAMIAANSPLATWYEATLRLRLSIVAGDYGIDKPLLLWVNDGLMALFFFMIGLELKREALEGELREFRQVLLPLVCAVGGFVVPGLIYAAFNHADATALRGWAIPSATDIAFSLGVLALLGNRVSLSLKVFLSSLAIFDDVAAILVIALFYAQELSKLSLAAAAVCCVVLLLLNRANVTQKTPYAVVGLLLWIAVLKSGVHATLAGVVVALTIPMSRADGSSPLRELEDALHPWVVYAILPLFAFANAGVTFEFDLDRALSSVPVGIAVGLFVGKQVGVLATAWLMVRTGIAALPSAATWSSFYGVALLTGIGFTMSLFIGTLAFGESGSGLGALTRLGVIVGSLTSALAGYAVLRATLPPPVRAA